MDVACVVSVSVLFRSKNEERESKTTRKMAHFISLVSFLARPKPKIPLLGLSLLRNQTEALATQARVDGTYHVFKESKEQCCH